jgi:hypothetical protein
LKHELTMSLMNIEKIKQDYKDLEKRWVQLLPECKIGRKSEYNYYLNVKLGEKVSTIITWM